MNNDDMNDRRIGQAFARLGQDAEETLIPSRSLARLERKGRPWLVAVAPAVATITAVVVAVILFGTFRTPDQDDVAAPISTTSTTLATTTTVPPDEPAPTTSPSPTVPRDTTTMAGDIEPPLGGTTYTVVNVAADDLLFVRAEPRSGSDAIGSLNPGATGVRSTGRVDGIWVEVVASNGNVGWASSGFLMEESGDGYVVVGVDPYDVLFVRSEPDATSPAVGSLAHDAVNVALTGRSNDARPPWWEVRLADGTTGWSHSNFLDPPPAWQVPGTCQTTAVYDNATTGLVAEGSDADSVMSIDQQPGVGCMRTVVTLGSNGTFTPGGWSGEVATAVPAGASVSVDGQVVKVLLPGVQEASPVAVTFGTEVPVFVVRDRSGDLRVDVVAGAGAAGRVEFLESPARIVIDTIATGPPEEAVNVGPTTITTPTTATQGVAACAPGPIEVAGYSRPFEATGLVEVVRLENFEPAGPADATITTDLGVQHGSRGVFSTSDWTVAWGEFSFTIDGLAPDIYNVSVGEESAADGAFIGTPIAICIGG